MTIGSVARTISYSYGVCTVQPNGVNARRPFGPSNSTYSVYRVHSMSLTVRRMYHNPRLKSNGSPPVKHEYARKQQQRMTIHSVCSTSCIHVALVELAIQARRGEGRPCEPHREAPWTDNLAISPKSGDSQIPQRYPPDSRTNPPPQSSSRQLAENPHTSALSAGLRCPDWRLLRLH